MQPATARDEAAISPRRGGSRRQPVEMDPAWQARRLPPKQPQRWPEKIDPGSRRRTSLAVSAEKRRKSALPDRSPVRQRRPQQHLRYDSWRQGRRWFLGRIDLKEAAPESWTNLQYD